MSRPFTYYAVGSCLCENVDGPFTEHHSKLLSRLPNNPGEVCCEGCGQSHKVEPFPPEAYVGFSGRYKEWQFWLTEPPADIWPKGFHRYLDGVKQPCDYLNCCKPVEA